MHSMHPRFPQARPSLGSTTTKPSTKPATKDEETFVKFVENQQLYSFVETEQLRLMICSHEGDRLGAVDLSEYDGKKADVSILIFDSCNRCKGFAKSALHLALVYAKSLGITTIYATIYPQNTPSVNLFKNAGFEYLGSMRYAKKL